jgi:uncharacterized protein YbjT (DUF2867 family)
MPAALAGVEVMYLAPVPWTVREVVTMAKRAGVRCIVDLSGFEADSEAAGDPGGWYFYAVEKAVEDSGLAWTHLRPGEFMTNTLIWAPRIRATGIVRGAYPNAANAPIDLDDVAAVAAAVLLEDSHVGEKYQLTGPEAITRSEMARQIGLAIGRDVRFEEQSPAVALADMRADMGDYADLYLEGLAQLTDRPLTPLPTVAEITGRPAITFAQWAAKHASEFM